MERASVFEGIYLGPETVPGTAVPALKRISDFGIDLVPQIPVDPVVPYGSKVATGAVVRKEHTTGDVNGVPGFLGLPYVLSSALCQPTIETPGGATNTRRWTWTPKAFRPDNVQSYTGQKGGDAGVSEASYLLFNSFSISLGNDGSTLSGSVLGRNLDEDGVVLSGNELVLVDLDGATGGTFTLTFGAQATGALDFDSTASEVQTALEGLSTIGSGNIRVTQPAADQFLLEFKNDLGQSNVGAVTGGFGSLTGSGGGAAVTVSTAGQAPTVLPCIPFAPRFPDVFLADTVAGLAAGQLDRGDMVEFGLSDRFTPYFTLDSRETSYSAVVERAFNFSNNLRMMHNSTSLALLDEMRAGQTKIMRVRIEQDEIEPGFPYVFQLTMGCKLANPQRGDNDGVYANTFELIPVQTDELSGGFLEVVMDTSLTEL